jgi:hypothetical protein
MLEFNFGTLGDQKTFKRLRDDNYGILDVWENSVIIISGAKGSSQVPFKYDHRGHWFLNLEVHQNNLGSLLKIQKGKSRTRNPDRQIWNRTQGPLYLRPCAICSCLDCLSVRNGSDIVNASIACIGVVCSGCPWMLGPGVLSL